jgi:hypothetical protein
MRRLLAAWAEIVIEAEPPGETPTSPPKKKPHGTER